MKNPMVFADILIPLGFMAIFLSDPSSGLISIARRSSFNFTKHVLANRLKF